MLKKCWLKFKKLTQRELLLWLGGLYGLNLLYIIGYSFYWYHFNYIDHESGLGQTIDWWIYMTLEIFITHILFAPILIIALQLMIIAKLPWKFLYLIHFMITVMAFTFIQEVLSVFLFVLTMGGQCLFLDKCMH